MNIVIIKKLYNKLKRFYSVLVDMDYEKHNLAFNPQTTEHSKSQSRSQWIWFVVLWCVGAGFMFSVVELLKYTFLR